MENAGRPSTRGFARHTAARRTGARLYALAGAGAFAASLGYFVYTYGVRLGAADGDTAPLARGLAFNAVVFAVFAMHHSLLARSPAKRWVERHLPDGLERATYVWVASILFALTCALWQPLPGNLYRANGLARAACFLAQAAGIVLILRGGAVLDLRELCGIRQAAAPRSGGETPELRIRGPYRRLRHPLYAGLLLGLLGTPDMTCGRLSFALLSAAYIAAAIPWEERDMAARFGERYERYRAQVPWRLVPGIY
ncbi:MAG: isoprenylcysteine carboxylmethyltransferase family protein [Acidobacteria bacterium]|nr:isoprenylcysteine carboxylmethyltransferase family protein [Acidobacteriota bacterium]